MKFQGLNNCCRYYAEPFDKAANIKGELHSGPLNHRGGRCLSDTGSALQTMLHFGGASRWSELTLMTVPPCTSSTLLY